MDAGELEAALRRALRGEVRFDAGSRALYSTDASNYRQVPIGVVLPMDATDVLEALRVCREFGAPVLSRGGGTSLAGQCFNVAVVLDMSRHFHRVLEVEPDTRLARVEPGASSPASRTSRRRPIAWSRSSRTGRSDSKASTTAWSWTHRRSAFFPRARTSFRRERAGS